MTDFRALCAELADSVELLLKMRAADAKPMAITEDRLCRARVALAQPEPQTSKKELTDEQLLKCFKIATPCYNMEEWKRELDEMRAAIAADRALRAELRGKGDSND